MYESLWLFTPIHRKGSSLRAHSGSARIARASRPTRVDDVAGAFLTTTYQFPESIDALKYIFDGTIEYYR